MMYLEFLILTEDKASYEQFLDIEKVYMAKEEMTKQQAASLWKRRYGVKPLARRSKEMASIKSSIRDLISDRSWVENMEKQIEQRYNEVIAEYDPNNWVDRNLIQSLEKRKNNEIYDTYETHGNDISIHIIYEDGSECFASGSDILSSEITPKMQHIAYASYEDGYTEYDTFTGCLDEQWDLSEDEGIEAREQYYTQIEIMFNTEWGRKQKTA